MVYMEDQIIEDIYKVEKATPKKDISVSNVDPIWLPSHNLDVIGGDDHNSDHMIMLMINNMEMR